MSIGGQPPGTAGKVPFLDTAVESFYFVFSNLGRFFALGWLPLVIGVASSMASGFLTETGSGENRSGADWVIYIVLLAASIAMYIVFAVRWHRFFLLDERESVFGEILAARNWRFLGYTLLLTYAPFVPMLIEYFVGSETFWSWAVPGTGRMASMEILTLAGLYLFAVTLFTILLRFYLVLPATAVGRPLTLGDAWDIMRGNSWRLIGAAFLGPVMVTTIYGFMFRHLTQPVGGDGPQIAIDAIVLDALADLLAIAVGITVLSKFYRHIVGGERGEGGAVTTNPA